MIHHAIPDFDQAIAAFRCGDSTPIRAYLELPIKHECEDCGDEAVLHPHSAKSLICIRCWIEREKFLSEVIK